MSSSDFDFSKKEKSIEVLKSWIEAEDQAELISKVQELFNRMFIKNRKVANVTYTCESHEALADDNEAETIKLLNGLERTKLTREDLQDFKSKQDYHLDYYKSNLTAQTNQD